MSVITRIILLSITMVTLQASQKELFKDKLIGLSEFRDPFSWLAQPKVIRTSSSDRKALIPKQVIAHAARPVQMQEDSEAKTHVEQPMPIKKEIEPTKSAPKPSPWSVVGVAYSASEPLALLSHNEYGTKLARTNDDIGGGWHIGKITSSGIVYKHTSGVVQELVV